MKTSPIIKITGFTVLLSLVLAACTTKPENNDQKASSGKPPVITEQTPEQHIIANTDKAYNLKLAQGTIISIPAHAFVDAQGNNVTSPVTIQYKEQKNAVDILRSGIPMEYDSAGTEYILQTAGMFEINGTDTSGKAVFIHSHKKIQISMLSAQTAPNYNFYRYDTVAANWVFVEKSTIDQQPNTAESANTETIPPAPAEPKKYNPGNYVLDMKINVSEFPELQSMKGLMWEFAGENKADSPEFNAWIYQRSWSNIRLELINTEKSIFQLTLTDSQSSFKTTITPVLAGKSYAKAMKDYKKKFDAYSKMYAEKLAQEQQSASSQNLVYRTIGLGKFGIYNHDRLYRNTNPRIAANFVLENGKSLNDYTVYLLCGEAATVVRYPQQKWQSFAYPDTKNNCLVVFLNDGKVAIFSNKEFEQLNAETILKDLSYTFELKTVSADEINADALKKMMKI